MKNNSGITLIALVVTMIIMLILAAISVATLSGDNSLIKNAGEAKQDADVKQEEDIINQAVYQAMNNNRYGELDKTELENALNSIAGKDKEGNNKVTVTLNGNKFKAYFTDSGRCYTIDSNGKSRETAIVKVGDIDLSTVSDLSTKYGETVNYKSKSHPNINWQLFLADEDNYYLIASDYVPTNELPCSGNTMNGVTYGSTDLQAVDGVGDSNFKARFASSSSYNDYVMTSSAHSSGADSTVITNNPLTSTYLKWVKYANENSYKKDNVNMKAVAYMMDTSKWSSFADGTGASYAIGGPTIEMFVKSYNEADVSTHTNKLVGYDDATENNGWTSTGYQEKTERDSDWKNYGTKGDLDTTNTTGDIGGNMWIRNTDSKAVGYWLASPLSTHLGGVSIVSLVRSCL